MHPRLTFCELGIASRKNSAKTGVETMKVRSKRTRSNALEIPKSTVKRTVKTMRKSLESRAESKAADDGVF